MKLLFLDDYRDPINCLFYMCKRIDRYDIYELPSWFIVRNYPEFVAYIEKNGLPDLISYDHDLADGHYHKNMQNGVLNYSAQSFENDYNKTGYHCAKWLVDYCLETKQALPDYIVHSMNPVGTENIQNLLENYKKHE